MAFVSVAHDDDGDRRFRHRAVLAAGTALGSPMVSV